MASSSSTARRGLCAGALLLSCIGCAGRPPKATGSPPVVAMIEQTDAAAAAPTESSEPDAPASASLAPLPPPDVAPDAPAPPVAPHVLLADELPYFPVRLRAHDTPPERHHSRRTDRAGHAGHTTDERVEAASRRPYHPAPGIVVDVIDAQGGLSAADLQRTARSSGYWPLRQCYEEGLRKDQRLAGKISIQLIVTPGGAIDRSEVTATTLHDEIVAACVAREARHLGLAASASADHREGGRDARGGRRAGPDREAAARRTRASRRATWVVGLRTQLLRWRTRGPPRRGRSPGADVPRPSGRRDCGGVRGRLQVRGHRSHAVRARNLPDG